MKKLFLITIISLLLTGCFNQNNISKEKKIYNSYIKNINNRKHFDTNIPFDINTYFDKIDSEEVMYRVIIDNPKISIFNIEAIAIHNIKTKDIYPTSGIFDDKLNLLPNIVNEQDNNVKGIILIGYIPYKGDIDTFNCIVKVLVKYQDEDNKTHKVFYKYQK